MKLIQLTLTLAILSATMANAASSYKFTLPSDVSVVGDVQLKAGEYSLTLEGKMAVLKKGKLTYQIPAIVEKNGGKFPTTMLEITGTQLVAVDLGGTETKIVFRPAH